MIIDRGTKKKSNSLPFFTGEKTLTPMETIKVRKTKKYVGRELILAFLNNLK